MCGRFVASASVGELAHLFDAETSNDDLGPSYNVSPSSEVYGVYVGRAADEQRAKRRIEAFSWGLLPMWKQAKSRQKLLINARAETVDSKVSFAQAFTRRRCIIPADGFYEWTVTGSIAAKNKKQPMFIFRSDRQPLCMAGIWESHQTPGAENPTVSFAILTTEANSFMSEIHDRMPVILPRSSWDEWLDPLHSDVTRLKELLVPAPDSLFEAHPVDLKVGNPRNNSPELITQMPHG